jgi:hypothetical protein
MFGIGYLVSLLCFHYFTCCVMSLSSGYGPQAHTGDAHITFPGFSLLTKNELQLDK